MISPDAKRSVALEARRQERVAAAVAADMATARIRTWAARQAPLVAAAAAAETLAAVRVGPAAEQQGLRAAQGCILEAEVAEEEELRLALEELLAQEPFILVGLL